MVVVVVVVLVNVTIAVDAARRGAQGDTVTILHSLQFSPPAPVSTEK